MRHERMLSGVVWAAAALLLLAGIATIPFLDPDEPRFARTSLEMLRRADPIVPYYAGLPRLVKPPLLHWLQSFLFRAFGPSEWAARLPSVAATLATIALAAHVARKRFGEEAAIWTTAVLASMPLVIALGRIGTLDALLTLHVFGVVALDRVGMPGRGRDVVQGALLGLGFLVKGPIGLLLPLLMLLAGRTAIGAEVVPAPGTALRAAAAAGGVLFPWLAAFLSRVGLDEAVAVLRRESLDAYVVGTTHSEPFWYYAGVVAVGFLPWSTLLALGLGRAWRGRRDPGAATAVYSGAALIAALVFLSLGQNKLASYVLPLAPLAALLVAWEIGQERAAPLRRTAGATLVVATLGATAVLLALAQTRLSDPGARQTAIIGAVIYTLGAIVAGSAALRVRPLVVHAAAAGTSAAFLMTAIVLFLPDYARTRSLAGLIADVPELRSAPAVLAVEHELPSLVYYLDRVPEWIPLVSLAARLDLADLPCVVIDRRDFDRLSGETARRLTPIGGHGKVVAFREVVPELP